MIRTNPVHPNRWRFYMEPLMEKVPEFNWFFYGKPYKDDTFHHVIEIDRSTLFFDRSTGWTYHKRSDPSKEEGECRLLIVNDNKKRTDDELSKLCDRDANGDPSKDCLKRSETLFSLALREKYDGIAIKIKTLGNANDLICQDVEFLFNESTLERSTRCPYIEYARSHESYLRSLRDRNLPSIEKMRPGDDSLKLRAFLLRYLA
jgi:hypothetical protein